DRVQIALDAIDAQPALLARIAELSEENAQLRSQLGTTPSSIEIADAHRREQQAHERERAALEQLQALRAAVRELAELFVGGAAYFEDALEDSFGAGAHSAYTAAARWAAKLFADEPTAASGVALRNLDDVLTTLENARDCDVVPNKNPTQWECAEHGVVFCSRTQPTRCPVGELASDAIGIVFAAEPSATET